MQGVPGIGVPIKRQALDAAKGGIPMYNPAFQQLAYAQQQSAYVPAVSCKYAYLTLGVFISTIGSYN